jgi:hypothetical protein
LGLTAHVQSLCAFEQALPPVSLQIPPGTWFPVFVEQTPTVMLPLVDGVQWT